MDLNDVVKREYQKGKTMDEIGSELKMSSMAVFYRLKRMGVTTRKRGYAKIQRAAEIKKAVLDCWKKHDGKISGTGIGTEVGCSSKTACKVLKVLREEAKRILSHPS